LGRSFVVTNSNDNTSGAKKKTVGRHIVIGPNAIKFVALTIIAILAIVYLNQSTAGASRSLKIRDIEGKKSELILEKERLETEQTRLKALKEIDSQVEKNTLEPVSSVGHIQNGISDIAKVN
jgi:hypothetical protein